MFASVFLLPHDTFTRTVLAYPINIDYTKRLRENGKFLCRQ